MTDTPNRQPRVLRVLKPTGDSPELPIDRQNEQNANSIKQFRAQVQRAMANLCVMSDVSEGCQVLTVKIADLITRGIEGQMQTLVDRGQQTKAELDIEYRRYEENEISDDRIVRLERQLRMFREQYEVMRDFLEAAKANGDKMRAGLNFPMPSYQSIKAIGEVWRHKRMMRESRKEAERLIGMSEADFRKYRERLLNGPRNTDGVESDDGYGNNREEQDAYRAEQEKQRRLKEESLAREQKRQEYRAAGLLDPDANRMGAVSYALGVAAIEFKEKNPGMPLPWE